jgi:hypothetical protein
VGCAKAALVPPTAPAAAPVSPLHPLARHLGWVERTVAVHFSRRPRVAGVVRGRGARHVGWDPQVHGREARDQLGRRPPPLSAPLSPASVRARLRSFAHTVLTDHWRAALVAAHARVGPGNPCTAGWPTTLRRATARPAQPHQASRAPTQPAASLISSGWTRVWECAHVYVCVCMSVCVCVCSWRGGGWRHVHSARAHVPCASPRLLSTHL